MGVERSFESSPNQKVMPKNKPKGFLFSAAATSETNSSDDCTQSDWRGKTASLLHTGSKIFFWGGDHFGSKSGGKYLGNRGNSQVCSRSAERREFISIQCVPFLTIW